MRIQVDRSVDTEDQTQDAGECACKVCQTIDLLSRRWTLHVLDEIRRQGPIRFNELKRQLGPVSSRTLSTRLDELVSAGFVDRHDYEETPPRVEYDLTDEGRELQAALGDFVAWAGEDEC